ncbi:7893_t:CDS:2 [Ambispora gerdemannii]|uniref:7893_t:CDS:1 n=1 Tax=Ambispora gerdemannii TaxID=144530 RepID=A0A9N9AN91_9GLOM|nr:7893_t:CDS:2 [Ambispora gerdemannii]
MPKINSNNIISSVRHLSASYPPNDNNNNNNDLASVNHRFLDELISKIEPLIKNKVDQYTNLSLLDLITPKAKSRKGKTPRPQNPFVLYRRNVQAKLIRAYGKEIGGDLATISKAAAESWKKESAEVHKIFEFIANLAKAVHEEVFPNYVYKPKKRRTKGPIYDMDDDEKELLLNVSQSYQNLCASNVSSVDNYHHFYSDNSQYSNCPCHIAPQSSIIGLPPIHNNLNNNVYLPPLKMNSQKTSSPLIHLPSISQSNSNNSNSYLTATTNVPTENESYVVLMAARFYQCANFTGPYVEVISPEPRCQTFELSTTVSSVKATSAKLIVQYYSHPNCCGREMLKTVGDESNFKKSLNILSESLGDYEKQPKSLDSNRKLFEPNGKDKFERASNIDEIFYLVKQNWGNNFSAPMKQILESGANVLDVSCGPGMWVLEMASDYTNSTFTGIDEDNCYPTGTKPINASFCHMSSTKQLLIREETFDYVHYCEIEAEPHNLPIIVKELRRVTKINGWVELLVNGSGHNAVKILGKAHFSDVNFDQRPIYDHGYSASDTNEREKAILTRIYAKRVS